MKKKKKKEKNRVANKSRRYWAIFYNRLRLLVRNIDLCSVTFKWPTKFARIEWIYETTAILNGKSFKFSSKWRLRVEIFVSFCFSLFISFFHSMKFFAAYSSPSPVSSFFAFYWLPSDKWISTMKLVSNYLLTNWLHQSHRTSVHCKL